MKGGEARNVWVYPDTSVAGAIEKHSSTEGYDAAIRLGYVAFSRASETLTLCAPSDRKRVLW